MALELSKSPIKKGELAVVVGAGSSGEAAVRLLIALGAKVRLVERSEQNISENFWHYLKAQAVEVFTGEHSGIQFVDAHLVVTSPGVPLAVLVPHLQEAAMLREDKKEPRLLGELELALSFITEPIIAVTGTSGKTTTVSLIAAMLEEAGKKVFLGGNIGTPLSVYVLGKEKADICVLECSSFQLQTSQSLHPQVAILLNLTENHLDQHTDMNEYINAKLAIFARQTNEDLAIIMPDLLSLYEKHTFKAPVKIFTPTARFIKTQLVGSHNAANAEVAFLACQKFGVTEEMAIRAVSNFKPLKHRLETVCTTAGITYVNDSKSTTVESLRVALASFSSPVYLLAGGKFKGGDLQSLRPLLTKHVRAICLYGTNREIFESAWHDTVPLFWDETLDSAFTRARTAAKKGAVILLSPATASYDQYANYQERGEHFCRLAREAS